MTLDFDPEERPNAHVLASSLKRLAETTGGGPMPLDSWVSHTFAQPPIPTEPEPSDDPLVGQILAPQYEQRSDTPIFVEAPTSDFQIGNETNNDDDTADYWDLDDVAPLVFDEPIELLSEGPGTALPSFDGPWNTSNPPPHRSKRPSSAKKRNNWVFQVLIGLLFISTFFATCMGVQ